MANANQPKVDCGVKTEALTSSQCNRAGLYNIVGVGLWLLAYGFLRVESLENQNSFELS